MKKVVVLLILILSITTLAATSSQIFVETTYLSGNTWQLNYTVTNITLDYLDEMTVWLDYGEFENIVNVTSSVIACDILIVQPEPLLADSGYVDFLFDTSLLVGESFSGLSIEVDFLGNGEVPMQFYEIVNPIDFTVIDSGYTIPEPATILLLGLGGLVLRRRK